ncbi:MAG: Npt1/Npt2 family nucleotide transporter, partial [Zetaproteobacteria bacterium]|nr:Npt1/Npt2 family nucleotide transporter [Zetaproteobacteria bacterium]
MHLSFRQIVHTLFPLERSEIKNFLVLSYCILSMTFIYNFLRPLKSTLVIAMSTSGAEAIPFLKVWGILPAAFCS